MNGFLDRFPQVLYGVMIGCLMGGGWLLLSVVSIPVWFGGIIALSLIFTALGAGDTEKSEAQNA